MKMTRTGSLTDVPADQWVRAGTQQAEPHSPAEAGCRLTGWWQKFFCVNVATSICDRAARRLLGALGAVRTLGSGPPLWLDEINAQTAAPSGKFWALLWERATLSGSHSTGREKKTQLGTPRCRDGKPGDGRPHSPHQQAPGRLQLHRPELPLGPAADSGGRRAERREELGAGEFRRQVVTFIHFIWFIWCEYLLVQVCFF